MQQLGHQQGSHAPTHSVGAELESSPAQERHLNELRVIAIVLVRSSPQCCPPAAAAAASHPACHAHLHHVADALKSPRAARRRSSGRRSGGRCCRQHRPCWAQQTWRSCALQAGGGRLLRRQHRLAGCSTRCRPAGCVWHMDTREWEGRVAIVSSRAYKTHTSRCVLHVAVCVYDEDMCMCPTTSQGTRGTDRPGSGSGLVPCHKSTT
jgi:hypothetical protein